MRTTSLADARRAASGKITKTALEFQRFKLEMAKGIANYFTKGEGTMTIEDPASALYRVEMAVCANLTKDDLD